MTALPRLATERLVLRPFVPEDAPTVERLAAAVLAEEWRAGG